MRYHIQRSETLQIIIKLNLLNLILITMKRINVIIGLVVLFAMSSNAQVVYTENFEGLNIGEGISQQVPATWTTWNNNPGSSEDPVVSDTYAHGGTKSLVVGAGNDAVMIVGTLSVSRYKMDFYLYVPTGRCGFYSPMQVFNPATSVYHNGCQIFFNNGEGSIDASGTGDVATFTFNHDTWLHVVQYFDFDNDITDIYINDELIHSGAWSSGINFTSNTLDGFDFYGWDESTPEFYVDDVVFEQVVAVNPPQNLVLEVQNDFNVQVSWDVPISGTPESYLIYRDDEQIATVVGEITYFDEHLYPANYEYYVVAYYGTNAGSSIPTEVEPVEILGGVARELALLEIFTGTECVGANSIRNSLTLLQSAGLDYVVISFVQDAGYEATGTGARLDFYTTFFDDNADNELLCPSSIVNGMYCAEGYLGSLINQKNYYSNQISAALNLRSLYTLLPTVIMTSTSPYEFNISVDVEELSSYYDDEIKLFAVITESDIEYPWQGISDLDNTVRFFDSKTIDFSTVLTQTADFSISIDPSYNAKKCDLVLFLQNMNNANILEAYSVPLANFISVDQFIAKKSKVYPIPANDRIFITSSDNIKKLEVMNCTGQIVLSLQQDSDKVSVDLSELIGGIYFVKIFTTSGIDTHKIIID